MNFCDALGVSCSGCHAASARRCAPRAQANERLLARIQTLHSHPRGYGSPRSTRELQATGSACSVNRVARVMRTAGLRVRARSPDRPKPPRSIPLRLPLPNLLAQVNPAEQHGTPLVSDLFSRSILGWCVARESAHKNRHRRPATCSGDWPRGSRHPLPLGSGLPVQCRPDRRVLSAPRPAPEHERQGQLLR